MGFNLMKFFGWFLAFAGTLLVALLAPLCMDAALAADELAQSQPLQGQIGGQLLDRTNGLPVPGARVTLYRGSTRVATTTSDSGGSFKFPNQSAGIYYVTIERTGYNSARSDDIVLGPGELSAQVTLALGQSTGGESSPLREIGRVSSSSTLGSGLQSTSTINYTMASQAMLDQNYNSVGDAIG
ncbi:MAG TPA: carboxypeptidase-like regulatory domain-containing protein, partial [Candidatus Baltobacteraceae bacterium]|nr:carboxypeptidase-like regulatory domain-containing protein [Candidatus Baltobacteraceae bacterium]